MNKYAYSMALEADSTLCTVNFLQLIILKWQLSELFRIREKLVLLNYGPGSVVGIATVTGWKVRGSSSGVWRDYPHSSLPALGPAKLSV